MMFASKIGTTSVFLLSLASTAGAQWINYPTPGIPRTKDGKPNLMARAPRLDPFRIVSSRYITFVLHEANPFRQIFTDGRPLPKEMNPTWMGYSVGRWDGETFVVTTAGFNDRGWLDFVGKPNSEALRVTERFRRPDFGHLQVEITYDDPKTYVTVAGDTLTIEMPDGGGRQRVFATADKKFVFPSTGGVVTFGRDSKTDAVSHLVLTIVEGDFRGDRK